jgi:hypothetical protein
MRMFFTLPKLHRCDSGAEIAFNSFAKELSKTGCAAYRFRTRCVL